MSPAADRRRRRPTRGRTPREGDPEGTVPPDSGAPADRARRRAIALAAVAAGLAAAVAWSPALGNGFSWDDRNLIVENDQLAAPGAAARAFAHDFWESEERLGTSDYYRPLVTLSYVADHRLHGLRPAGYHATNLALHAAATALLALFLAGLGLPAWQAGLGAALFGVHPALAETVAWVAGRTDPLATVLVLCCLLADRRRERPAWRAVSLVALAAALLAKEIAVVAPGLALLADVGRGRRWREAAVSRWDMLVVLAAYFALRRAVLGTAVASQLVLDQGLGWPARLLALPHLAGLLPAPFLGRIDYSGSLPPGPLVPAALAGVALLAVLGLLARRARTGPSGRPFAVLLACGAVSLAPAAAVIAAKGVVGDRLVYLAAAFLLPAVVVAAGSRLSARRTIAVGVVLVVACGTWAGFRSLRWRSQRALFEEAIAEPHASSRVYTNLGIADHDEGRLEEAVDRFEGALARGRQEKAHYMLGLVYTELGCDDLAIRHYGEATAINPGDATAANNLGALLAENGRRSEAERVLVRAIARNRGRSAALRTNLEILRAEAGAPAAAPAAAQPDCGTRGKVRALLRDPRFLNRRANERLRVRQFEQSRVLLDAAERLAPDLVAVHLNRAQWHVLRGEFRAARRILEDVLRREPGNVHALRLLERISSESHLRLPPRSP